ncbi:hypothetical protein APY03_1768 [Variovorax sp. WDL1]|nr:hypothetical protein APY03_1768 [Variovorax sp. WDL1]
MPQAWHKPLLRRDARARRTGFYLWLAAASAAKDVRLCRPRRGAPREID